MIGIKVVLADNNELFREGVANLLESQPEIEVVYKCLNGPEAVEKARQCEPDVVLMDTRMPGYDGIEAAQRISKLAPNTKVAMLTDSEEEESFFAALRAGAKGYLLKNIGVDVLKKSVGLLAKGEIIVSPPMGEKLVEESVSIRQKRGAGIVVDESTLSDRETEVLGLVAGGSTNRQIAETLIIAENTVKVHMKNILGKLHLHNKQQAAVYAIRHGLGGTETKAEGNSD